VAGRFSKDIGDDQVTARDGPPMVAVLPFAAVGGGEDSIFFAAGVHDDLLTQLAQQPSMRVISRTSVLEYKDTQKNIREIGEELRADAILEGGVQSAGDRIRINAQLIDARTDEHLWAETFDR
jgi:TolB-like protein